MSDLSATGYTWRRIRTGEVSDDRGGPKSGKSLHPADLQDFFWSFQPEGRPTTALSNDSAGDASPPTAQPTGRPCPGRSEGERRF
jgi:hypothetical protein